MGDYVVESQEEAIRILRSALEQVVVLEGNFKYAVAEGIVAIEKQIPKKPMQSYYNEGDYVWECLTCGNTSEHYQKYCVYCGQRLD